MRRETCHVADERDPLQEHVGDPIPSTVSSETRIRARLFLVGWLLLPWGFAAFSFGYLFRVSSWVVLPPFLLTCAAILCVKYALPPHLETGRISSEAEAAARILDWPPDRWKWIARISLGVAIVSLATGVVTQWT